MIFVVVGLVCFVLLSFFGGARYDSASGSFYYLNGMFCNCVLCVCRVCVMNFVFLMFILCVFLCMVGVSKMFFGIVSAFSRSFSSARVSVVVGGDVCELLCIIIMFCVFVRFKYVFDVFMF